MAGGPSFRIPEQLLMPWHPRHSISVPRVAEMLDCSHDTVLRLIEEGAIDAYRLRQKKGSPWKVNYDSVIRYIDGIHAAAGLSPRYKKGQF